MLVVKLLLLISAVVAHDDDMMDPNSVKAQEACNCFFAILCEAHKAIEFRRVMLKAGPKLLEYGLTLFPKINHIYDAEDTEDFWNHRYPDIKCILDQETKTAYFMEWMKCLGEYWAKVCAEDETGEECVKMSEAAAEYNLVTEEYTIKGVCTAVAQEYAEEGAEKGKEAVNDMKDMKPPSEMEGFKPKFG